MHLIKLIAQFKLNKSIKPANWLISINDLDDHVAGDEIVPVELPSDEAAELGDDVFDPDHAAGPVLPLCQQVPVHLVDDIPDGLLPDLQVVGLGAVTGSVHDGGHIDSGSLVDKPPQ